MWDVWDGWPVGTDEAGVWQHAPLVNYHVMISGTTGAGKTAASAGLLRAIGRDPRADLLLCDPSDGPAIDQHAPLAATDDGGRPAFGNDPQSCLEVLQYAHDLLFGTLKPWLKGRVPRQYEVRRGDRMTYLYVDEGAQLWKDPHVGDEACDLVNKLSQTGRKYGLLVVHTVTRSANDSMPLPLRENTKTRIIMNQGGTNSSDLAFGYEASRDGYDAKELPDLNAFITSSKHRKPVRVKLPYYSVEQVDGFIAESLAVRKVAALEGSSR